MEHMIQMVVFDMAGTTVDEDNVVYKSVQQAIHDAGFTFTLPEVLASAAGKEKRQAIVDVLALNPQKADDQVADQIYQNFLQILDKAYSQLDVVPQQGAIELFERLKQHKIKVVLNTGYNLKTAQSLLAKLHWEVGKQIDLLVTADQVKNTRPHPDMIFLAMQTMGISDPQLVVKVGDSIIDIEEGKNAGCRFSIGITTGAHRLEQLQTANPDYIIHHLNELMGILHLQHLGIPK
jgi:phosphonatase-like hydrolase